MLYIKSLELNNVRCFGKKQTIDFTLNTHIAQWTVILGNNGSGKTTLLKSIVAMLPSPQNFYGRRNLHDTKHDLSIRTEWGKDWSIQRNGSKQTSKIRLEIQETGRSFGFKATDSTMWLNYEFPETDINVRSTLDTKLFSPIFCFAYGANRKTAPNSLSGNRFQEANETLFKEDALLQNSEEFFLQLDYETAKSRRGNDEFNRVKNLIKQVLPDGVQDIRVAKSGHYQREVQVLTSFGWVAINDLSIGYKTTIGWLIDFANKMIFYHPNSDNPFKEASILIIDEIDLHMHPKWQYEIISNLTKLFPKTQFIVTAHSPLIAQAALEANLVLLEREGKEIVVKNDPDVVRTWRVDQVLTSDLFGIENSRPKRVQGLLSKRVELLSKEELDESELERLRQINEELGELPVYENEYQRRAYSVVDKIAEILKNNENVD